ncbi:hypothetical protein [Ruegeria arenilitoris]|uniref:hypothetical protein n=1 Tax=Ruegeria arenilitoris TaxID=1173585 RepID=UPI0014803B1F|nr:hypothetical protein [Ruegeria arenilitoris]
MTASNRSFSAAHARGCQESDGGYEDFALVANNGIESGHLFHAMHWQFCPRHRHLHASQRMSGFTWFATYCMSE